MTKLSRRSFSTGLGAGLIGSGLFARSVSELILPSSSQIVLPQGRPEEIAQTEVEDFHPHQRPSRLKTGNALCLSFVNLHTGEKLKKVEFWTGKNFEPQALNAINNLFRDFRNNKVKSIDPQLLLFLHKLHQTQDTEKPFQLISGFRSSETNSKLHAKSHGVAKNSYHTKGQASDVAIEGRRTIDLARAARSFGQGGVGCYPEFVHVDTGPLRKWGMI